MHPEDIEDFDGATTGERRVFFSYGRQPGRIQEIRGRTTRTDWNLEEKDKR